MTVTLLTLVMMTALAINDTLAQGMIALVAKMDVKLKYTNFLVGLKNDGSSLRFMGNYVLLRYVFDSICRYFGALLMNSSKPFEYTFRILAALSFCTCFSVFYKFREKQVILL